jgi:hypothetical protein
MSRIVAVRGLPPQGTPIRNEALSVLETVQGLRQRLRSRNETVQIGEEVQRELLTAQDWSWILSKREAAFPGAEGWGSETTHARDAVGAQVLFVTNLNDSGAGSFRAAITTPGPRVILFKVSGYINLANYLVFGDINDPSTYANVAIYGQTAPSPGITVAGNQFAVRSTDVLIQHLRFRHGNMQETGALNVVVFTPAARVVIDHLSASWATNDNTSVLGEDITWSDSISSESLYGLLTTDNAQRIVSKRNLFAHVTRRTPNAKGGTNVVWVNNFVYNSGIQTTSAPIQWAQGNKTGGQMLASVLGTVTKDGPTNPGSTAFYIGPDDNGSKLFLSDNVLTGGLNDATGYAEYVSSPPYPLPSPLEVLPSADVEAHMVANVGARPTDRDPVDTRIINEVVTGTGRHILTGPYGDEDESVVGGYPPLAENFYDHETDPLWLALGLNNTANRFKKDIHPFYSRVELYVAAWTAQVQDVNLIPDV